MVRPRAIILVAVMQAVYTVLMAALTVYCVVLARSATKSPKADAGAAASGLVIGAIFLGVLAVLFGIGALGLWRARRWGWIASLASNALIPVLVLWDILIDRDHDPENWVAVAIFGLPVVLLLLPAVRRAFSLKGPLAAGPLTTNS